MKGLTETEYSGIQKAYDHFNRELFEGGASAVSGDFTAEGWVAGLLYAWAVQEAGREGCDG
jgi:hypothetical protein